MKDLMKDFGKVVEGSSGALSFGVIQCMAAAVTNLSRKTGVEYFGVLLAAVIATVGFFMCIFSVGQVIHEVSGGHKVKKLLLFFLLYPAVIGVFLSVKISLVSISN